MSHVTLQHTATRCNTTQSTIMSHVTFVESADYPKEAWYMHLALAGRFVF